MKTKIRTMWVHYGLRAVRARVFWSRNGLAVTRVGRDEYSLTHVMTGNRIGVNYIGTKPLHEVIKIARVLAPICDWKRLSFHCACSNAKAMKKRSDAALRKAGLL